MTVKLIRTSEHAKLPEKGSKLAAGHDLYAAETVLLKPQSRALVSTGWKVCVPPGHEVQVRPRSGLALKQGVTVLNTPGTVDEDYLGPLGVVLFNTTDQVYLVAAGTRIAQMVVKPVVYMDVEEVDSFDTETERGESGFGSTGV